MASQHNRPVRPAASHRVRRPQRDLADIVMLAGVVLLSTLSVVVWW